MLNRDITKITHSLNPDPNNLSPPEHPKIKNLLSDPSIFTTKANKSFTGLMNTSDKEPNKIWKWNSYKDIWTNSREEYQKNWVQGHNEQLWAHYTVAEARSWGSRWAGNFNRRKKLFFKNLKKNYKREDPWGRLRTQWKDQVKKNMYDGCHSDWS